MHGAVPRPPLPGPHHQSQFVRRQRIALHVGLPHEARRGVEEGDEPHIGHQEFFCLVEHGHALLLPAHHPGGRFHQCVELRAFPGMPASRHPDAEHVRRIEIVHAVRHHVKRELVAVERLHEHLAFLVCDGRVHAEILLELRADRVAHRLSQGILGA